MTNKKDEKFAVWVTDKAKDATFDNCEIEGLKNEGKGTKVLKTKIFNFREKHSGIWRTLIITITAGLVVGIILLEIEYKFFIS